MAPQTEISLNEHFADLIKVYIRSFPASYLRYGEAHGAVRTELGGHLRVYAQSIQANAATIYEVAAKGISKYLYLYNVYTEETVDEYKLIYFLGQAIEESLPQFKALKGAHLFTMVALLDYRLQTIGINKDRLRKVLTKLIREGGLKDELGPTGCYLIFKCVSTTERVEVTSQPEKVRGTGLDARRGGVAERILGEKFGSGR